ncbi:MAG: hypothetical protein ACTSO9_00600 [Candidatus Helarchaeota archaeon]
MHEYNVTYALIMAIVFLTLRLSINIFDWNNPPARGIRMAFGLYFGALFLLGGISALFDFDIINLLSVIIILYTATLLLALGFIEPNKNFLIYITICGVTYFGSFVLIYNLMINSALLYDLIYIGLFAGGFALSIALSVGIVLNLVFKKKWPKNQESIWQIRKFWEIINNKYVLIILIIICMLELPFRLRSQSLITLFFQL